MKKYFIVIVLFLFNVNSFAQLPDLETKNLNGEQVALDYFSGKKYTIIDFWATWCKPCVTAIPKLNSIYEEFASEEIAFIGVNIDGPRNQSKVKPFVYSLNVKYPIVLDPDQEIVEEFRVTVFPTLIIVDDKGDEVFVHEGFIPGDERLIKNELVKLIQK